jgi:hypothetical protein
MKVKTFNNNNKLLTLNINFKLNTAYGNYAEIQVRYYEADHFTSIYLKVVLGSAYWKWRFHFACY